MQSSQGVLLYTMNSELRQICERKMIQTVEILNRKLGMNMPVPALQYKQIGRTAGLAYCSKGLVVLNPDFFIDHADDMIHNTIPHEVCHIAAYYYYTTLRRIKIKGHGPEWKSLMRMVGLSPDRCHNYSMENVKSRQRAWYTAKCCSITHCISSVVFNRVEKGKEYMCRRCGTMLKNLNWILKEKAISPAPQIPKTPAAPITLDFDIPDDFGF